MRSERRNRCCRGSPTDDAGGHAEIERMTHEWASQGLRVLLLTWHPDPATLNPNADDPLPPDLQPLGLIGLVDVLRPEAKETLARFKNAGVTVRIISGDDPETVAALAKQAGLEYGAASARQRRRSRGQDAGTGAATC